VFFRKYSIFCIWIRDLCNYVKVTSKQKSEQFLKTETAFSKHWNRLQNNIVLIRRGFRKTRKGARFIPFTPSGKTANEWLLYIVGAPWKHRCLQCF